MHHAEELTTPPHERRTCITAPSCRAAKTAAAPYQSAAGNSRRHRPSRLRAAVRRLPAVTAAAAARRAGTADADRIPGFLRGLFLPVNINAHCDKPDCQNERRDQISDHFDLRKRGGKQSQPAKDARPPACARPPPFDCRGDSGRLRSALFARSAGRSLFFPALFPNILNQRRDRSVHKVQRNQRRDAPAHRQSRFDTAHSANPGKTGGSSEPAAARCPAESRRTQRQPALPQKSSAAGTRRALQNGGPKTGRPNFQTSRTPFSGRPDPTVRKSPPRGNFRIRFIPFTSRPRPRPFLYTGLSAPARTQSPQGKSPRKPYPRRNCRARRAFRAGTR